MVDPVSRRRTKQIEKRDEVEPQKKIEEPKKDVNQTPVQDANRQDEAAKKLAQPTTTTTSAVTNGDQTPVDPSQRKAELESQVPEKDQILPERQAQIDQFLAEKPDRIEPSGKREVEALKGNSSLGPLSDAERSYLIDRTIDRFAPSQGDGLNKGALDSFAFHASKDQATGAKVGERMALRALELKDAKGSQTTIETLAATSVMANPSAEGQRALMEKLGPQKSVALLDALDLSEKRFNETLPTYPDGAKTDYRMAAAKVLIKGLSLGEPTETSAAVLDRAAISIAPSAFKTEWGGKQLGENLGAALAQHWYTDPAKRTSEARRLSGILGSEAGRELVGHPSLTPQARLERLQLLAQNPDWTAESFQKAGSLSEMPQVLETLAKPKLERLATLRGDEPQKLAGTDLENTIGFSMGFSPKKPPPDETAEQRALREKQMAEGNYNAYAGTDNNEHITKVADSIRSIGGNPPEVTVLNVQFTSKEHGVVDLPLYRVKNTQGADQFVDNMGRTYSSFDDWKQNNQLEPGTMTYPKDGKLGTPPSIETTATPRTVDTPGEYVREAVNWGAMIGGTVAGVAVIAGTGGAAAPIVATAAGLYGAYTAGENLYDRYQHGQSINPLQDRQAFSAWFNVAAGTLGAAGGGASALGRLTTQGTRVNSAANVASTFLNGGAMIADAASATDAGVTLAQNWDRLSGAERLQLGLTMGFWGVSAAKSARQMNVRPFDGEIQRKAQIADTLQPDAQNVLAKYADSPVSSTLYDVGGTPSFRRMSSEEQVKTLDAFANMPQQLRDQALNDLNAARDKPALQLAMLERMRDSSFVKMKPEIRQKVFDELRSDPRLGETFARKASQSWENMTPVERQRFFFSENPEAFRLTRLSPEQFESTFGKGPYHDSLAKLGADRRFSDVAVNDPAVAKDLADMAKRYDVVDYWNKNPTWNARQLRQNLERQMPQSKLINDQGVDYVLQTHPAGLGQPVFRLTPPESLDHNGAFAFTGKTPSGKYETTGDPRNFQLTRADQIRLEDGRVATNQDWDRIAVFAGHGSTNGFEGLTTKQAAQMTANQLIAARKQGRTIDYVLLESCSQGTGRGLFGGKTNAQEFQAELNAALVKAGQKPVQILAAKQAGYTFGGTEVQTTFGATVPEKLHPYMPSRFPLRQPIDYVTADNQPGGMSPQYKARMFQFGVPFGIGMTGIGVGGGAIVYTVLSKDDQPQKKKVVNGR